MLLREHQLTEKEIEYLLALPIESEEAWRFVLKLSEDWTRQRGLFIPTHGRWDILVWFASQERIMPEDEMMQALSNYRKEHDEEISIGSGGMSDLPGIGNISV